MSARKFAPAREDGRFPYVRTRSGWGRSTSEIVWADSLRAAKAEHGWTRELHTSISVRRASPADVEGLPAC